MKALAINASPKMDNGNTSLILEPFLEGMREAGAQTEVLYTRKLRIEPCMGDNNCWFRTPGACVQHDDMARVLAALCESEIWVFATPLYVDGMAGPLKNLVDRMIPLAHPFIDMRDGHCAWRTRDGVKSEKVILVSSCGFWEADNFDPLVLHVRTICRRMDREFAGALLRPHATLLRHLGAGGGGSIDVFDAARNAGCELIRDGEISSRTLATIRRPLVPLEDFVEGGNRQVRTLIDHLERK